MYIDPFVAGICATIIAEMTIIIVYAVLYSIFGRKK